MKLYIIWLAAIFLCSNQECAYAQQLHANQKEKTIEIIKDKNFDNGVQLFGTVSAKASPITQLYPFGKTNTEPIWALAQWGSNFNFLGNTSRAVKGGTVYENEGKRFSFIKEGKSSLVSLEVFGAKEYPSARIEGQDWPHLLFGQDMTTKVPLNQIKKLSYTIDARLMYDENKMGALLDPKLHTSQVSLYLSIQNINKSSADYSDYFWFGLPLYDYRYKDIKEYAAQDLGKEDATKKFILNVASKELFKGTLHDKKWINIEKDIYPLIIRAFKTAKERGFLKNTDLNDLAIGSMNLGWEVPGTFDCGLQFKNLSLTATLK